MCRHTNYPSPGPHTGTLQWLKLLQHAAFSVMKHEPGAAFALGFPGAGTSNPPATRPHGCSHPPGSSAWPFPAVPCAWELPVTQDRDQHSWHPGVARTCPFHPHPAAPSARPLRIFGNPQAWGGRSATKWFWICWVFLHGCLFGAEIKG